LTYPLQAIRHYQRHHKEDGSYFDAVPKQVAEKTPINQDYPIFNSVELPDGWFWSYKVEKPIICKVPIKVTRDMIKKDTEDFEI